MKSFSFSAAAVIALLAKQAVATPPSCLLACVAQVTRDSSKCSTLNQVSCLCENESSSLQSCLSNVCKGDDASVALVNFESSCKNVGAELKDNSSSSGSSSSSSHSSSSSAEESSSSVEKSSSASPSSSSAAPSSSSEQATTKSSSVAPTTTESSSAEPTKPSSVATSSSTLITQKASSSAEPKTTSHSVVIQSGEGIVMNAPMGALVGAAAFGLLF